MKYVLLMLMTVLSAGNVRASSGAELFAQAQTVAQTEPVQARKLFQLSALEFEGLAQARPELRADALYNAGNAWFYAEERGRALYACRRAEVLMPFNGELKENLAYLLQLSGDSVAATFQMTIWQKVRAVFPFRVRVMWLALFALATCAVVGCWQWRGKLNRVLLAVFGSLAVVFGLSVLLTLLLGPRNGVVLSAQSVVRKGDGYIYKPAFAEPLGEATEFRVHKIRGAWVQVVLSDGNQGWLPRSEVGLW